MAKKTYFPYSWTIDDEQDECTLIRSYGLDENNKSICVIINDFTPYIYVELPRHIEWTETRAQLLTNKIDDMMGEARPIKRCLQFKKKLYYAHISRKTDDYKLFPFLFLSFSTKNDIRNFIWKTKRRVIVPGGIGQIQLKVHEQDANPILQLTSIKDIPTCGWILFKGKEITGDKKETYCDEEYHVKWKNMIKQEKDEVPTPLVMGMDAEVNSSNPNVFPNADRPDDKMFQIACVFSRGKEEVEKYILNLGNPDQKTTGKDIIIRTFKTEGDSIIGYRDLIIEKNPQIVTGYNILGFDIIALNL